MQPLPRPSKSFRASPAVRYPDRSGVSPHGRFHADFAIGLTLLKVSFVSSLGTRAKTAHSHHRRSYRCAAQAVSCRGRSAGDAAGPLTLTTPQWIPGHHMPSGPVEEITGVVFTANGQTLPWRRDDVDLYQFHLTIPAGVTTLHAHLDCIVTARISQKLAAWSGKSCCFIRPTRRCAIFPFSLRSRFPRAGASAPRSRRSAPARIRFPRPGAITQFAVTNVEQLEDSPVITGQYFHEFPLAPAITPKHYIDVVSDYPEDSNLRPAVLASTEQPGARGRCALRIASLPRLPLPAHAL